MNERLGTPSFLWASQAPGSGPARAPKRGETPVESTARNFIARNASAYNLSREDIDRAHLTSIHDKKVGPVIATFTNEIDGIPVFRDRMAVALDRKNHLVAISGSLAPRSLASAQPDRMSFTFAPEQAIAAALADMTGVQLSTASLYRTGERQGEQNYTADPIAQAGANLQLNDEIAIQRVYFRFPDHLESGYQILLGAFGANFDQSDFLYVLSATDGKILYRGDLTAYDATPYSYRVFADANTGVPYNSPIGVYGPNPIGADSNFFPAYVSPNLVTAASGPISTGDPWLPPGATQTTGNNSDAYADLLPPTGFNRGDLRAVPNGTNTFDYRYDVTAPPDLSTQQQMASIVNCFYLTNYLHDWWYDAGFDEASGNAQTDNYSRGGKDGDPLLVETQDWSGTDNSNMATRPDGHSSRMQMYTFTGLQVSNVQLTTSGGNPVSFDAGVAGWGSTNFNVSGKLVYANTGRGSTPHDGCSSFSNKSAIAGNIALIDRGTCTFEVKVQNAQSAGATGAIIANVPTSSNPEGLITMAPDTTLQIDPYIPALQVRLSDGDKLRDAASNDPSNQVTLNRGQSVNMDGALDTQVVTHEFGHMISNRLIGDGSGLQTVMSGGMGEGWSDFDAILFTVRPEDALMEQGANFSGAYPMGPYVSQAFVGNHASYFGIRRYPYSTDMTKNPLTYADISAQTVISATAPSSGLAPNEEVHSAGEVWTSMLWECYAALLRDTLGDSPRLAFNQAQDRMKKYIIGAFKITPINPTMIEARDAVLAVAYANDPVDFAEFSQAFAKRGLGIRAQSPDRYLVDLSGAIESYESGSNLSLISATVDDSVSSCNNDGVLDVGETGKLNLALLNNGTGALNNTIVTVSSDNPNVAFPEGNQVTLAASTPTGTVTGSLAITLTGGDGPQDAGITVTVEDPDMTIGAAVAKPMIALNWVDVPNATATENFAEDQAVWDFKGNSPYLWWTPVAQGALDWRVLSANTDVGPAYAEFISPPLSTSGSTMQVTHRYSFGVYPDGSTFDGGIVEVSTDGGATYTILNLPEDGQIDGTTSNPLAGLNGFVGQSASYPDFITSTVQLPDSVIPIMVRFTMGVSGWIAAPGWEIKQVSFTGLQNLPFPSRQGAPACGVPSVR